MKKPQNLNNFEKKIEIDFKDKKILQQVFIHRSFLNENPEKHLNHNERLEFLGDAVLEFIVTEYLYQNYPDPEGELTSWRSALVKGRTLSDLAKDLDMNEYLLLSRGEAKSEGRAREFILANAYEALIGAIYLDQGMDKTTQFVNNHLIKLLPEIIQKGLHRDPKSYLQEIFQAKEKTTPIYKVIKEIGPDHNKEFIVGVFIDNRLLGEGKGNSKQLAQRAAASAVLSKLELE